MFRSLSVPLARFGLALTVVGVMAAAAARPAAAQSRFNIHFTQLRCVEETDGLGSDETYVVYFVADLQPAVPETMTVRSSLFNDVDSGENHDLGTPLRLWGLHGGSRTIANLSNVILLAGILESDGSDRNMVRDTVEAHLNAVLPGLVADFRAHRMTRATMISRLIGDMNNALDLARADGGDDRIGSAQEIKPDPATGETLSDVLLDAQNGGTETFYTAIFRGDGARYRLRVSVTSSR